MPDHDAAGVDLHTPGWLGAGAARTEPVGMTILLHPTAYRAATDEQLVELVRSGDDRAFDAIHDRYHQRLLAFARSLLGGAHHDHATTAASVKGALLKELGTLTQTPLTG